MTSDVWVEWMHEAELLMGALMVEELRSALLSLSPDSPFFGALFPPLSGAGAGACYQASLLRDL